MYIISVTELGTSKHTVCPPDPLGGCLPAPAILSPGFISCRLSLGYWRGLVVQRDGCFGS